MTLGEKLRALRAISGWTQPECAEKMGIEQSYLSKLENDKSTPSAEIFDALCAAYKASPDDIVKDLDKDFVRRNLMHIPMVAAKSNGQSEHLKKKRKSVVIISSLFILIAILLFSISSLQLISSNKNYEYRSDGADFKHEINACMKTKTKQDCFLEYTAKYDPKNYFHSTHNAVSDTYLTNQYQGKFIHKKLAHGFRDYSVHELAPKVTFINKLLQILAILLASIGVLALFVEARFYRIDKL